MNKVFQIELCKEDAQRILDGVQLLKQQTHQQLNECKDEKQQSIAWLEWSYISELLFDLECKFHLESWR